MQLACPVPSWPASASENFKFGLSHHAAGRFQQFAVSGLHLLLALLALVAGCIGDFQYAALQRCASDPGTSFPASPAAAATLFITRVNTRTPSPSNVLSVG